MVTCIKPTNSDTTGCQFQGMCTTELLVYLSLYPITNANEYSSTICSNYKPEFAVLDNAIDNTKWKINTICIIIEFHISKRNENKTIEL